MIEKIARPLWNIDLRQALEPFLGNVFECLLLVG